MDKVNVMETCLSGLMNQCVSFSISGSFSVYRSLLNFSHFFSPLKPPYALSHEGFVAQMSTHSAR